MKLIELKCSGCYCIFKKQLKEYNRQIKNGNNNFYCTSQCCGKYTSTNRIKHSKIKRICVFCKTEFVSTTHRRHKKCCNKICAVKYAQKFVNTEKISNSLKLFNSGRQLKRLKCSVCDEQFPYKWNKKTCSIKCCNELLRIKSTQNPNCGGETNYRKFQYKNVWMDSSWEVNIAKWLDKNKIDWKRDRKINFLWTDVNGTLRRYYPDFYLPKFNIYLDPKNKYKLKKDQFKLAQVIKENNINLISGAEAEIIENLIKLVYENK